MSRWNDPFDLELEVWNALPFQSFVARLSLVCVAALLQVRQV